MKKKITLIFPRPVKEFEYSAGEQILVPLPLVAVSSILKQKKFEIKIIDMRIEKNYEDIIAQEASDSILVGFSVMTGYQIIDSLNISKQLKKKLPNVKIVWGGYHPSLEPEQIIAEPSVDFVIQGQGENTLAELAEAIIEEKPLETIKGLIFKDSNKIIYNPKRGLEDINTYPSMPYDVVDVAKYVHLNKNVNALNYVSSAGCVHRCGFCANVNVYGRNWSGYSATRVINELKSLVKTYNIGLIYMDDNNFFYDNKRAYDICKGLIDEKLNILWYATVRADKFIKLDTELIKMARKSGLIKIMVGAESGDREILKLITKDADVEDILQCAKLCRQYDIIPSFAYIFGFPVETSKEHNREVKATIDLIKKVKEICPQSKITPLFFVPYPGTALYELGKKLNVTLPQTLLEWGQCDPRSVQSTPWITADEKERIRSITRIINIAYPNKVRKEKIDKSIWYKLFSLIQRVRLSLNCFGFQLEWKLIERLLKN